MTIFFYFLKWINKCFLWLHNVELSATVIMSLFLELQKGTYDIKTFVIQKYTMWNCLRNTYDIQKGTYYIKTFV